MTKHAHYAIPFHPPAIAKIGLVPSIPAKGTGEPDSVRSFSFYERHRPTDLRSFRQILPPAPAIQIGFVPSFSANLHRPPKMGSFRHFFTNGTGQFQWVRFAKIPATGTRPPKMGSFRQNPCTSTGHPKLGSFRQNRPSPQMGSFRHFLRRPTAISDTARHGHTPSTRRHNHTSRSNSHNWSRLK